MRRAIALVFHWLGWCRPAGVWCPWCYRPAPHEGLFAPSEPIYDPLPDLASTVTEGIVGHGPKREGQSMRSEGGE